uniref:Uncharacterized protein n=1 Tax=Physcomitrium patens TaxID=3218 RepID=A0A7I4DQ63_PHYPA
MAPFGAAKTEQNNNFSLRQSPTSAPPAPLRRNISPSTPYPCHFPAPPIHILAPVPSQPNIHQIPPPTLIPLPTPPSYPPTLRPTFHTLHASAFAPQKPLRTQHHHNPSAEHRIASSRLSPHHAADCSGSSFTRSFTQSRSGESPIAGPASFKELLPSRPYIFARRSRPLSTRCTVGSPSSFSSTSHRSFCSHRADTFVGVPGTLCEQRRSGDGPVVYCCCNHCAADPGGAPRTSNCCSVAINSIIDFCATPDGDDGADPGCTPKCPPECTPRCSPALGIDSVGIEFNRSKCRRCAGTVHGCACPPSDRTCAACCRLACRDIADCAPDIPDIDRLANAPPLPAHSSGEPGDSGGDPEGDSGGDSGAGYWACPTSVDRGDEFCDATHPAPECPELEYPEKWLKADPTSPTDAPSSPPHSLGATRRTTLRSERPSSLPVRPPAATAAAPACARRSTPDDGSSAHPCKAASCTEPDAASTRTPPPLPEVRTRRARVVEPPRVATPSLLPGMCERTLRPVVAPPPHASPHLEFEHPELIAPVHVHRRPRLLVLVVRRNLLNSASENVGDPIDEPPPPSGDPGAKLSPRSSARPPPFPTSSKKLAFPPPTSISDSSSSNDSPRHSPFDTGELGGLENRLLNACECTVAPPPPPPKLWLRWNTCGDTPFIAPSPSFDTDGENEFSRRIACCVCMC